MDTKHRGVQPKHESRNGAYGNAQNTRDLSQQPEYALQRNRETTDGQLHKNEHTRIAHSEIETNTKITEDDLGRTTLDTTRTLNADFLNKPNKHGQK